MSVFLISEVSIKDLEKAEIYKTLAAESIQKFGGRYLVRGADLQTLEGRISHKKLVIVEFPNEDRLQEWYHSSDYKEALLIRDYAIDRDLFYVQGS